MKSPKCPETLNILTAPKIHQAELKLREWTKYSVQSYILFAGANDALRDRLDQEGDTSQLAALYREDPALMTVIRMAALFDRDAEVSFQAVYRGLNVDAVCEELVALYIGRNKHTAEYLSKECRGAISMYLDIYNKIDFAVFGKLKHFRNLALAHISWEEARKYITYDDLRGFIYLAADLSEALSMICRGLNASIKNQIEGGVEKYRDWWIVSIRREMESREDRQ